MVGMAESIQGVDDALSQSAEVENQEITEFRATVRILTPHQAKVRDSS
jgi:hypothetical protein